MTIYAITIYSSLAPSCNNCIRHNYILVVGRRAVMTIYAITTYSSLVAELQHADHYNTDYNDGQNSRYIFFYAANIQHANRIRAGYGQGTGSIQAS